MTAKKQTTASKITPESLIDQAVAHLVNADALAVQRDRLGSDAEFEAAQAKALVAIAKLLAEQWREQ